MKPEAKSTLTITEVAKKLGIGRNRAYAAANSGKLPAIRLGNRLVVPINALESWLDKSEPPAPTVKQFENEPAPSRREIALLRTAKHLLEAATADQLKKVIELLVKLQINDD